MPVAAESPVHDYQASEQTLGIVLGAVLAAAALGTLFTVLCLALRQTRARWTIQARTRGPLGGETHGVPIRALSGRKIFSSRSANAPEACPSGAAAMAADGQTRLSASDRPSLLHVNHDFDDEKKTGMLADIDESPHVTTPPKILSDYPKLSDDRQSRISLSKYHTRSVDVLDAASRYSDSMSVHRNSETRSRISESTPLNRMPAPAYDYFSGLNPHTASPVSYNTSSDDLVSPIIPAKHPERARSPTIHYPSWNELQNFDFNDVETHQPQRPKSTARMSQAWRAGGDQISGRYELG